MITVLGKVFRREDIGSTGHFMYVANIRSIGTFVYPLGGKDRWRVVVFKMEPTPLIGVYRRELGRVTITGLYNALKQAVEQMRREADYVRTNH